MTKTAVLSHCQLEQSRHKYDLESEVANPQESRLITQVIATHEGRST